MTHQHTARHTPRFTETLSRALAPGVLGALLFGGVGLCAGLAPLPAHAQAGTRAYAPERIGELSVADQRRVIALEYSEQSGGRTIPDDQMRFYLDQIRLSRWTFSQVKREIATSLRGQGDGQGGQAGATIRCESQDGRQRTCQTPWARRSTLVRQMSGKPCVQGQTWFTAPGSVSVSGGCRAEFAAARGPGGGTGPAPNPGADLQCESPDNRYRQCGSGLTGNATLVRQLSGTPCVQGQNWGLRDGSIWVDRGCRGVFRVAAGGASDYTVTCASENGRQTTCAWDRRRGVPTLLQTLSKTPCTEGHSWGYQLRQGLWVSRGCRGRFGVR